MAPITDLSLMRELEGIPDVYRQDNVTAWDLQADGTCSRRIPRDGEARRAAQDVFVQRARGAPGGVRGIIDDGR